MNAGVVQPKPVPGELAKAVALNDIQAAEDLLRRGADFTEENTAGWDMLTSAANYGRTEIIRLLIVAGADVNRKSHEGVTPLMRAARMGHVEPARVLIDNGADMGLCDGKGLTAQHYAESRNRVKVIKMMQEASVRLQERRAAEASRAAAIRKQRALKRLAHRAGIIRGPRP